VSAQHADAFSPDNPASLRVFLHAPPGGGGLFTVRAQAVGASGTTVADASWQVPVRGACTPCGDLALPYDAPDALIVRFTVSSGDQVKMQDELILTLPAQGQERLAPLRRLERIRPTVALRGSVVELQNDNTTALFSATVHAGRTLIFRGSLLPWERRWLDVPNGILPESLRVEALNGV
jgi:hypothetical protein